MTIISAKVTYECNNRYIGFLERWKMFHCSKCKKSGIDIEEDYTRYSGKMMDIDWFEPPWFEDEDEYHSALLSWLNDSDEEYTLYKENNILYVCRIK